MNVVGRERVPGGWLVVVEVPNAYTDGSARAERVFVPHEAVAGLGRDALLQVLRERLADPLAEVDGADLSVPAADTKATWEVRVREAATELRLWRELHGEAVAQGETAALVASLAARRGVAWQLVRQRLQGWRAAQT